MEALREEQAPAGHLEGEAAAVVPAEALVLMQPEEFRAEEFRTEASRTEAVRVEELRRAAVPDLQETREPAA
jgi:hypothetical protein